LSDPIGLAGTHPEMEVCVLTREVEKGGKMINDMRSSTGLKPVDLVFANMILAENEASTLNFSNKLSSTNIRQYLSTCKSQIK
jgi:phosphopantetheine adenylyltransferase